MAESRATLLFQKIVVTPDPVAAIEQMVADHEQEAEYLDFKTEGAEKDNRDNWSVALSGFANTEGGVIVWGIDCRKNDINGTMVDCANDRKPVRNPVQLVQQLRNWLIAATIDPVRGVDIRHYPKADGTGYVVCLIPQGSNPPYRATLEKSNQYWQRSQDKFVLISHHLLRSLFYPRTAPKLTLEAERRHDGGINISLLNTGTASAEDVALKVRCNRSIFDDGLGSLGGGPARSIAQWTPVGFQSFLLHPQSREQLLTLKILQRRAGAGTVKIAIYMRHQQPAHFSLDIAMDFAVDQNPFAAPKENGISIKEIEQDEYERYK